MVALGCCCPAKDEDQGDRGFKSGLAIFLTCLPGAGVINDAAGLKTDRSGWRAHIGTPLRTCHDFGSGRSAIAV